MIFFLVYGAHAPSYSFEKGISSSSSYFFFQFIELFFNSLRFVVQPGIVDPTRWKGRGII